MLSALDCRSSAAVHCCTTPAWLRTPLPEGGAWETGVTTGARQETTFPHPSPKATLGSMHHCLLAPCPVACGGALILPLACPGLAAGPLWSRGIPWGLRIRNAVGTALLVLVQWASVQHLGINMSVCHYVYVCMYGCLGPFDSSAACAPSG